MSSESEEANPAKSSDQFSEANTYAKLRSTALTESDIAVIKDVENKAEKANLYDNPIARINIGIAGENSDWHPTPESGLDDPFADRSTPELQSELIGERIADPETGQKLNIIFSNRSKLADNDRKQILVFMPPYNNPIDHDSDNFGPTNYRVEQLARIVGLPLVAIDNPGVGQSDRLTKDQKEDLKNEGPKLVAAAELRALRAMLQDQGYVDETEEIDLIGAGQSQGADSLLAQSIQGPEYGFRFSRLILIEPPRAEKTKVSKIMLAFAKEANRLPAEQVLPVDPGMFEASGFKNPSKRTRRINTDVIKSVFQHGLSYAKHLSSGGLQEDLDASLRVNPDLKIDIVHGDLSLIAPNEKLGKIVGDLKQDHSSRINEVIFPGQAHTVLENAKRFAGFVRTTIDTDTNTNQKTY